MRECLSTRATCMPGRRDRFGVKFNRNTFGCEYHRICALTATVDTFRFNDIRTTTISVGLRETHTNSQLILHQLFFSRLASTRCPVTLELSSPLEHELLGVETFSKVFTNHHMCTWKKLKENTVQLLQLLDKQKQAVWWRPRVSTHFSLMIVCSSLV